ncbi:hypothetical protein Ccrd_022278 [Cynara cardunculus var. scolymus]|uniref:Uncharacterized protein n=1 Tax=Cynara cardunculus var. scolymus TaxID=59895 RepID=A0A124SEA7_CYNCS|nr:hypothetical protein Ccrd_022278 [Cynara cardunculus var. scolymus]
MDVIFAVRSYPPKNLVETEKQMKKLKQKKETTKEDLQREEAFFAHVKYNFKVKKQEFVRFMAQSSLTQFKKLQGERLLDDDGSMEADNT